MRIWTIKEGEPLPIEGSIGRIMRCGIISRMLAERGHDVTWWSSTYSHQTKKYLRPSACVESISNNYKIQLLHSKTAYTKNISLARIRYHKQLAVQFTKLASCLQKPDAIYCSFPTIDFSYEAVKYGKKNNIPVIIDVRDFWPDIFIQPFPKVVHPFVKIASGKYERMTKYSIQNATAVIGVVPAVFEDWTVKKRREYNQLDHTVFLAYDKSQIDVKKFEEACKYWSTLGLTNNDFIVCYFGNIISRVDFNTIFTAAKKVDNKVKFVICGTGDYLDTLKVLSNDLQNIIYPGYKSQEEIEALMNLSSVGIVPYFNSQDFINAVPNKAIEYLAGGIPVISSLQGYLKKMLADNNCGTTYSNSDGLVSIINNLANDHEKLELMKKNSKNLYLEKFTAEKVYGELCDFIEGLKG